MPLLLFPPSSGGSSATIKTAVKLDIFETSNTVSSGGFTTVTGLSVSITPTSTTQKVRISFQSLLAHNTSDRVVFYRVARNGTTMVQEPTTAGVRNNALGIVYNFSNIQLSFPVAGTIIDAPATTSEVTYTFQIAGDGRGGISYANRSGLDSNDASIGIRTSSCIIAELFTEAA